MSLSKLPELEKYRETGVLWLMGSQRAGHDVVTKHQQQSHCDVGTGSQIHGQDTNGNTAGS